jgi:adenosylmethionine-8-amino-7-oxononanoate aminotransferase
VTILDPDVTFLPGRSLLAVDGGEGCHLITRDGRRVLDAAGGAIVASVGHGRREVVEAATRSLQRIGYVVPPFATPERESLIARLRDRWLPEPIRHVLLVSGGSEANDSAFRIARLHHASLGRPDRCKIVSLEPSYHGLTIGSLSASGHATRRNGFGPLLVDWPKVRLQLDPDRPALGYDQGDAAAHAAALEAAIVAAGPDTVAAFIAEPVGGAATGAATPPPGYWAAVAEVCRRHAVLLIADEVMCGFGRTGTRFAIEAEGVVPDILVAGKGLGGGYAPLGGVYATDAVVEPIAASTFDVMFFTFSASNVACAIADTVLDIVEREELVQAAAAKGAYLAARLHDAFDDHPHVAQVRGRGLLQGIEIVRDRDSLEPFPLEERVAMQISRAALRRDVWVYPAGSGARPQDCILLGPPFVITEAELDQAVDVLAASIDEVTTAT